MYGYSNRQAQWSDTETHFSTAHTFVCRHWRFSNGRGTKQVNESQGEVIPSSSGIVYKLYDARTPIKRKQEERIEHLTTQLQRVKANGDGTRDTTLPAKKLPSPISHASRRLPTSVSQALALMSNDDGSSGRRR